jgi:hypothetical protein
MNTLATVAGENFSIRSPLRLGGESDRQWGNNKPFATIGKPMSIAPVEVHTFDG